MSIDPKNFVSSNALRENINTLWNKYDKNKNNKLELDEFKALLFGCAKNWAYKLAVSTFGNRIYNNLKSYSKNQQDALSKQDIFTFAKKNNISINEKDSINTLIDTNIKSLNGVLT